MHQKQPPAKVARARPGWVFAALASRACAPASSHNPPAARSVEKTVSLSFIGGLRYP